MQTMATGNNFVSLRLALIGKICREERPIQPFRNHRYKWLRPKICSILAFLYDPVRSVLAMILELDGDYEDSILRRLGHNEETATATADLRPNQHKT